MSSTKRGSQRSNNDYYATPAWCTERVLNFISPPGGNWLEPGAGDGAIIRTARSCGITTSIHANELEARHQADLLQSGATQVTIGDFFAMKHPQGTYSMCIGNPPYAMAEKFVEHALTMSDQVLFLLRLAFLESKKRQPLLQKIGTPDVYVLPERPSFINGRTDSCAYGWFRWYASSSRTSGKLHILYG